MNKDSLVLLCEKNGEIFELFNKYKFDIVNSINLFMSSKLATYFDEDISMYQYKSIHAIFDDFEKENILSITYNKEHTYSNEACYYLGYIYRYYILTKHIKSKKMLTICPPNKVLSNYSYWHTLSFSRVVDIIQNEYKQGRYNHDVYQNKNKTNIKINFIDPHLYSFLAKRIIYKLNRAIDIKNLSFSEDIHDHLFVNLEASISLDVIKSKDTIKEIKEHSKLLADKIRVDKNILFIFSNDDIGKLIEQIKQIRFISNPYFNVIYIYDNKTLYLLDEFDNTYKYSVKVTKCDYNLSYKESLMFADE